MKEQSLNFEDFIQLVLDSLRAVQIDYLIGGAIAAWAWGEPRATQDLDLVVDLPVEAIKPLSQELANRGMLVPTEIILNTLIESRGDLPVHAIHGTSGFKADIYLLRPEDDLRKSALQRRQQIDFGPPLGEIFVHSPEDLILYKLIYYDLSQQTKHLRDIGAILHSQGDQLDQSYLGAWIERLGLSTIWKSILEEFNPS